MGFVRFAGLLLCAALTFTAPLAYSADTQSKVNQGAYDAVNATTNELLQLIDANRDEYRADIKRFYRDLDGVLLNRVDYKRIAQRIMGKFYKRANKDQREAFAVAVKTSLQKFYAKGLLDYTNYRVEVLPLAESKRPRKQKVQTEIHTPTNGIVPVSYSMYLNKQGDWMVENVIVNGINIGITYRKQFARLMKVNKKDIDLVISDWSGAVAKSNDG